MDEVYDRNYKNFVHRRKQHLHIDDKKKLR